MKEGILMEKRNMRNFRKQTKRFAAGAMAALVAGATLTAVPYNVLADEVIMEWREENGVKYWYENGVRQGVKYREDGSIDASYRGKEIYDPSSNAWYWLDCVQNGAVAKDKDVYQESQADDAGNIGKWVRYDAAGHMVKGWSEKDGNRYYFDPVYGTMAKGDADIDGIHYYFNKDTGILESSGQTDDDGRSFNEDGWHKVDGVNYWYENGVRQGVKYREDGSIDASYRGKEIYDPSSNAWYWLDCVQNGAVAKDKDVYQESQADNAGNIGKWVRYDADGHMVKGWNEKDGSKYYFDPVYGTMAKGVVTVDGKKYEFDDATGKLVKEVIDDNAGKEDNKENNIEWSISDDGKLTVTGSSSGKLYNKEYEYDYPWDEHKDEIKSAYINVTGLTDLSNMFYDCKNLEQVDLSDLDTSNVTDMSYMFGLCSSLSSLDLSGFDTSSVTDMQGMFNKCNSLSSLDLSGFDTSSVTNMKWMFSGCGSLSSVDVSGFNTSKVTDMGGMFENCKSLSNVDVSGFDTSNVTSMYCMFDVCRSLGNVDVSGFNTSKVTDMSYMFEKCSSLSNIDVSGFDTSSVTDMSWMFCICSSLSNIDVSGFDTSSVKNMGGMFYNCSSLSNIDVSGFDTSSLNDMSWMFKSCSGLSSLDLSRFDTGNVIDMSYMFYESNSLTVIIAGSGWDTSKANTLDMFYGCGTDHVTIK